MRNQILCRPAEERDLSLLARIEVEVWGKLGTPLISVEELTQWYAENSAFFIVAENDLGVCGYYFARQLSFNPLSFSNFLAKENYTGKGYASFVNNHTGNAVYAVSIASNFVGAGRALRNALHSLLRESRIEYLLGFSRIPGFRSYASGVGEGNSLDELALHYALESAGLLGMEAWCAIPTRLPPLQKADPVMAFHARGIKAALLGIVAGYMEDPESLNYGVLLASRVT